MISKHVNYLFPGIIVLVLALMLFIPAISIAADVTLGWNPNEASEKVVGYTVYYGYSSRYDENEDEDEDEDYEFKIDVGNQTTRTIHDLKSGQRCYFAVTAYIEGCESPFSDEIYYDVPKSTIDSDSDGLIDEEETTVYGTDPNNADTDGDGITDGNEVKYWEYNWEYNWGYNWYNDCDGDLIINLLDPDSDNDGFLDGLELSCGSNPSDPDSRPLFPCMETGEVIINHEWHRIEFSKYFFDPVVVAKSFSYDGKDPAILRIQNVDNLGFDIRIQEWECLDGWHKFETVGYIIMERGSYTLADGTMIEAGIFATDNTTSFKTVNYKNSFNKIPVVIAAVISYNEIDTVLCRTVTNGTNGFEVYLQEQNSQIHATEDVTYIAWEPSSGIVNGFAFDINIKLDINDEFQKISFNQTFENAPVFISDMQTKNGTAPANVRWRKKDARGVIVKVSEDQSYDDEINHALESVGFMAFSVQ